MPVATTSAWVSSPSTGTSGINFTATVKTRSTTTGRLLTSGTSPEVTPPALTHYQTPTSTNDSDGAAPDEKEPSPPNQTSMLVVIGLSVGFLFMLILLLVSVAKCRQYHRKTFSVRENATGKGHAVNSAYVNTSLNESRGDAQSTADPAYCTLFTAPSNQTQETSNLSVMYSNLFQQNDSAHNDLCQQQDATYDHIKVSSDQGTIITTSEAT